MCGPARGGDLALTPDQEVILQAFARTTLARQFYFGGTTALSEVHLQHRLSEDLDFFRQQEFDAHLLVPFEKALKRRGFDLQREWRPPRFAYEVSSPQGGRTRVDFAYYPYDRAEKLMRAEDMRLLPRLLRPTSKEEIGRFLLEQARALAAGTRS